MKVLFFSHQASFLYGGEIVTLEMLRALRAAGVDAQFASPAGPYADRAREVAPWHEVPSAEFSRSLSKLPKFVPAYFAARSRLKEIIEREGIQILHAQSLKAAVYCRGLDVPTVWHHHDIMPATFANDLWLRWLARGISAVVTPSKATKQALVTAGVDEKNVTVVENGFVTEKWHRRPVRGDAEAFTALVVGEISERKGSDWIPEIAKVLRERGKKTRIRVVGEGLSDPDFFQGVKIESQQFPEIEFLGRRADVPALLQQADALLVPSRQDPLPTVIVEAMLSGVPVIARPVGGIPEMVADGRTGYLCDSPEVFADALMKLEGDLSAWAKFSETAHKTAVEKYSVNRVVNELSSLYLALVRSSAR